MILHMTLRPRAKRPAKGDAVFYTDRTGKVRVYQVVNVQPDDPSTVARNCGTLDRLRVECEAVDFDNVFITVGEMIGAHNNGFHINHKTRKRD